MGILSSLPAKGLAALVLAGAVLASYWFVYQTGQDHATQAALVKQQAQDLRNFNQARSIEQAHQARVQAALTEATNREKQLRNDAAAAKSAADRLRSTLAQIQRDIPHLTDAAVRRYADAASVVFRECTEEYRALGAVADAIDSDRQTLEQAWPK